MSLLQSPRRHSDALSFGPHGLRDPDQVFPGFGGSTDETDAPRVDLGRTLDLSTERPQAPGRGPGVWVAAIVASSLTLAGIILLMRGDMRPTVLDETAAPAPITEVMSAPAELPAEPAAAEPALIDQSGRVASQHVPTAAKAEPAPVQITPAAIAPASSPRPIAPATVAAPLVAPVEVAPSSGLAPGLHLPPPVFDEPPATPAPTPVPSPIDDASDPLPEIEERAPAEPRDEPGAAAPGPAAPGAAAQPTHADLPAPFDVDELDHAPARTAS